VITAGICDYRNGAQASFCAAAIQQTEASQWVIFDIFGNLVDVRFTPDRDRNCVEAK